MTKERLQELKVIFDPPSSFPGDENDWLAACRDAGMELIAEVERLQQEVVIARDCVDVPKPLNPSSGAKDDWSALFCPDRSHGGEMVPPR